MTTARIDGLTVTHTGPPPYTARSASDRNPDWPIWFVADATGFNGVQVEGLGGDDDDLDDDFDWAPLPTPPASPPKVEQFKSWFQKARPAMCPHAAPFRYCPTCVASPCPIGLNKEGPSDGR